MEPEHELVDRIAEAAVEAIAAELPPGWRVVLLIEKPPGAESFGLN